MTVLQWINRAQCALNRLHPDFPRGQLRLLAAEVMGIDVSGAVAQYSRELTLTEQDLLRQKLSLLEGGMPIQYVLGHWDFMGADFLCDSRALIPREDTRALVEAALSLMPEKPCRVLDMGCGSGCVGLTLKRMRRQISLTLSDISGSALDLARENAGALGLEAEFLLHDMRLPLCGQYHVIVSNPPYISPGEKADMDECVLRFEPGQALFAAQDGMEFFYALYARARQSLARGGILAAECGHRQARRVAELFSGLGETRIFPDMNGIERAVAVIKE